MTVSQIPDNLMKWKKVQILNGHFTVILQPQKKNGLSQLKFLTKVPFYLLKQNFPYSRRNRYFSST